MAITIPKVTSTVSVVTSTIKFADGIVITIIGSNTIATRKAAYEAYIKSHPKTAQVKVTWTIKKK